MLVKAKEREIERIAIINYPVWDIREREILIIFQKSLKFDLFYPNFI
jgi:hypothetical protein